MNKLKVAIVGTGRIGKRHAGHIENLAELQAVCDIKKNVADSVGKKHSCNVYYDIDNLLKNEKNLNLVAICTPNGLHAEHTIKALKAGNHVLCEKPMATSVYDCEQMINTAEQKNKRLFVVKQNRFNPPVQAVKQAIDEGRLGKIFNVQLNCFWNRNPQYYKESDWKGTKDIDGGTLFTQFSHFIDLLYWLIGDVETVNVFTENFSHQNLIEFEDTGVISLKFKNDALGTINYTVCSYDHNMEGSITIFAENGTLKIGGQYLNTLEYQSLKNDYKIEFDDTTSPANDYGFYKGSMSNHDKVYENVIDVLTNQGQIRTSMLEGLKTVQIIEKIYKATKK
ncbi:MAG: Gfo/Idh/MocA family oxidoreductase [Candidatus Thermoplasmatota archaeon]